MWKNKTPGIPDSLFTRGNVPMTKEEVRMVTLCKGRIPKDGVVWDIGAGTGSLSVEAALQASEGQVYAVERDPEGIELIGVNGKKFGVENLQIIHGEAPDALAGLPQANTILVGGSGGRLGEILRISYGNLLPGGRLVVNAITLETLHETVQVLEQLGAAELDTVLLQVSAMNKVGPYHMLKALNPIYVISATREEGNR